MAEVRRMEIGDIGQVREIADSLNLTDWTQADYESALNNRNYQLFVAELEATAEITGFLVARLIMNSDPNYIEFEIINIGVKSSWQGKGISQALWNEFTGKIKQNEHQIYLEVRELNFRAVKFYEKNKMQIVGLIKNYYRQPTGNALIMSGRYCRSPVKKVNLDS